MKKIKYTFFSMLIFAKFALGFVIDPFPKNSPLIDTFSTNCLQMTQSQQILKAYVLVGLNSTFQSPQKKLTDAIPLYDKRMHEVRAYFHKKLKSEDDAKKAFDEALDLWNKSKKMLVKTPTKINALRIKKNFQIMINKLLDGTQPLATPDLELISLTGKLCRKPLEITIDYLMRIWKVNILDYEVNSKKTIDNYHKNIKILSANELNDDESRKYIKKAKREFKYLEMMYNSKKRFIPSLLSKKADDNFKIIREIKRVYKKNSLKK